MAAFCAIAWFSAWRSAAKFIPDIPLPPDVGPNAPEQIPQMKLIRF
jgi:hypothetical protein